MTSLAQSAGFAGLLLPNGVIPLLAAFSRDAVLMALARHAATELGLPDMLVKEALRTREALGSTSFGAGVAIPHARLAGLDRCHAVIARLPQPIDWQSSDGQPVDVAVLLLSPDGPGTDHLKALARISRCLRDPATLPGIRAAADAAAIRGVISGDVRVTA
ncbi:MAG: PTS sugar transporter subunit IIA [Alphaproteobacteria bacterium]|nr:PTS sugar transporter subunit IIA [Alphaproteobacteria bacterium]